jgi:hypothetical protein
MLEKGDNDIGVTDIKNTYALLPSGSLFQYRCHTRILSTNSILKV